MTITNQRSLTLNPFAEADAAWVKELLRSSCAEGLPASDQSAMQDQIEALVPALVELRNAGHITLNAKTLVDFASITGFSQLASDERLTPLSRRRCEAIRVRLIVEGVRLQLGHQ